MKRKSTSQHSSKKKSKQSICLREGKSILDKLDELTNSINLYLHKQDIKHQSSKTQKYKVISRSQTQHRNAQKGPRKNKNNNVFNLSRLISEPYEEFNQSVMLSKSCQKCNILNSLNKSLYSDNIHLQNTLKHINLNVSHHQFKDLSEKKVFTNIHSKNTIRAFALHEDNKENMIKTAKKAKTTDSSVFESRKDDYSMKIKENKKFKLMDQYESELESKALELKNNPSKKIREIRMEMNNIASKYKKVRAETDEEELLLSQYK